MGNEINPNMNSYVRDTDYKGSNKSMPTNESYEDSNVFYEVDENGNEVRRFVDEDKDGKADRVITMNSDGQIASEIIDLDRDGQSDNHVDYEYGSSTDTIESVRHVDFDMDGNSDVHAYVDENQVIHAEDIDLNDNGSVDVHVDYSYDNGIEQRAIDYNLDGKPDQYTNVDTTSNKITSEVFDSDKNGRPDTVVEYSYDEEGNESGSSERNIKPLTSGLPEGYSISGHKIFNGDGEEVGVVINNIDGTQTLYEYTD